MNLINDPLNMISDLRPAGLDRLAEDTYARRRAGDLARMLGEPASGGLLTASGLLVSTSATPHERCSPDRPVQTRWAGSEISRPASVTWNAGGIARSSSIHSSFAPP